jgi:hypothetical protein
MKDWLDDALTYASLAAIAAAVGLLLGALLASSRPVPKGFVNSPASACLPAS